MTAHHRTADWQAARRAARPRIAASLPQPCIDCGKPVTKDQRWQVGHRVSVMVAKKQGWTTQQINSARNLGPSHAKAPGQQACNQIAGGKLGAAKVKQAVNDATRLPNW